MTDIRSVGSASTQTPSSASAACDERQVPVNETAVASWRLLRPERRQQPAGAWSSDFPGFARTRSCFGDPPRPCGWSAEPRPNRPPEEATPRPSPVCPKSAADNSIAFGKEPSPEVAAASEQDHECDQKCPERHGQIRAVVKAPLHQRPPSRRTIRSADRVACTHPALPASVGCAVRWRCHTRTSGTEVRPEAATRRFLLVPGDTPVPRGPGNGSSTAARIRPPRVGGPGSRIAE